MNSAMNSLFGAAMSAKSRTAKQAEAEAAKQARQADDASSRGWLQTGLKGAALGFMAGGPTGALIGGLGGAGLGLYSAARDRSEDEKRGMWSALGGSLTDPLGGQGAGSAVDAGIPLATSLAYQRMAGSAAATPADERIARLQRASSLKVTPKAGY